MANYPYPGLQKADAKSTRRTYDSRAALPAPRADRGMRPAHPRLLLAAAVSHQGPCVAGVKMLA